MAAICCLLIHVVASDLVQAADAPKSTRDVLFLGDETPRIIRFHLQFDKKSQIESWKKYVETVFNRNDRNKDKILDLEEMRDFQGIVRNRVGNPLESLLDTGRSRSKDRVLLRHTRTVRCVRISADGQSLFSAGDDKTIKQWDLSSGRLLTTYTGFGNAIRALAVSPDGIQIAAGGRGTSIRLWQVGQAEVASELVGHEDYVTSLAFLPDGRELVSASFDGSVKVWNLAKSKTTRTFEGRDPLWTVDVSSDGKWIAAAGEGDTIRLWNAQSGELECEFAEPRIWTVAFSPDATRLASSGPKKQIHIWDIKQKKQLYVLDGHSSAVREVSFSSDGSQLVSGSWDKTARVWDLKNKKSLTEIKGHRDYVQTAAFTADGTHVVTGSEDRSIRYWDTKTGEEKPFLRVGTLSLEQFQNFLVTNDFAPFQVQEVNSNSTVTTSDGQNIEQSVITRLLLSRLDQDKNEKVSTEEIKNAATLLRPFDFNDDELISFDELNTLREVREDTDSSGMRQQNYASTAIELGGNTATRRIVYQLLYRYDRDRYDEGSPWGDRNRLNKEEIKLPDEQFAGIDKNSDNELDFQELLSYLDQPQPDLELLIRLDSETADQPRVEKINSDNSKAADIEVITNKGSSALRIGQLSVDLVIQDFYSAQSETKQFLKQQFELADINKNEYLETEEAEGNIYFGDIYADADDDKDEKLYQKELNAYLDERLQAARSRVQLSVANQGFDLFNILDTDRNQRLGARELVSVANRIDVWDQNGDNNLEVSDIPHYFRFTFGPENIGLGIPVPNQQAVNSGNGMTPSAPTGPIWFQKMDRNGDRDLSRREFLGPRAIFDKIDTDGDGLINASEAAAVK